MDGGSELQLSEEEIAIAAIAPPPDPDRTAHPGLVFPLGSAGALPGTAARPTANVHAQVCNSWISGW